MHPDCDYDCSGMARKVVNIAEDDLDEAEDEYFPDLCGDSASCNSADKYTDDDRACSYVADYRVVGGGPDDRTDLTASVSGDEDDVDDWCDTFLLQQAASSRRLPEWDDSCNAFLNLVLIHTSTTSVLDVRGGDHVPRPWADDIAKTLPKLCHGAPRQ